MSDTPKNPDRGGAQAGDGNKLEEKDKMTYEQLQKKVEQKRDQVDALKKMTAGFQTLADIADHHSAQWEGEVNKLQETLARLEGSRSQNENQGANEDVEESAEGSSTQGKGKRAKMD